ncbi:hypothetical protein LCGC14_2500910, partial [marine sediment metagenome]
LTPAGEFPKKKVEQARVDARQIVDRLFANGSSYTIEPAFALRDDERAHELATSTDRAYLHLLWMAQTLGRTRRSSVRQLISDADAVGVAQLMLGSALIGHLGFTVPDELDQSDHPVPIGAITAAKLAAVLRDVLPAPPTFAAVEGMTAAAAATTASCYGEAMARARRALASSSATDHRGDDDDDDDDAARWPLFSSEEEEEDDDSSYAGAEVYAGYAADPAVLRSSSSDDDDDLALSAGE